LNYNENDNDNEQKINKIDYKAVSKLWNKTINDYLIKLGFKYDEIKQFSMHKKKQIYNQKSNDKFTRIFNQ